MSRQEAISILSNAYPQYKDDLVIEYIQECDHQDGDDYWLSISQDELTNDFQTYIDNID